jgi:hypothetical protein
MIALVFFCACVAAVVIAALVLVVGGWRPEDFE